MMPFIRNSEELFSQTARRASANNKFKVVINGPTYGLTYYGKIDALNGSDPVDPASTLQEGRIVYKNTVIGGRPSNMFFVKHDLSGNPPYSFGRGEAPIKADAAIGNLGPLVINKLPYGAVNTYNPPKPKAKKTGEPTPKNSKYLTQRSNSRFTAMSKLPATVGKISLGYRKDKAQLIIIL